MCTKDVAPPILSTGGATSFCVSTMKRQDDYRLGNTDNRLYDTENRLVFRDVADIHDAEEHE